MRLFALAGLSLIVLNGCGRREPLVPAPGASLPPAPAMATRPATADELLEPGPEARPSRVDEVLKRSEEREQDRFDLPPQ